MQQRMCGICIFLSASSDPLCFCFSRSNALHLCMYGAMAGSIDRFCSFLFVFVLFFIYFHDPTFFLQIIPFVDRSVSVLFAVDFFLHVLVFTIQFRDHFVFCLLYAHDITFN
eukprot:894938_1